MSSETPIPESATNWRPEQLTSPTRLEDEPTGTSLDEYEPSPEQQARFELLRTIIQKCESAGIRISITGGYGLDGLYGRLTRDHEDIDLLAQAGKESALTEILTELGFSKNEAITARETYTWNADPSFKIEWASIGRLSEVTDAPQEMFMPAEPNATLQGTDFRTPILDGHLFSIELLTERAKQQGWSAYPPRKAQNKALLIEALKQREAPVN